MSGYASLCVLSYNRAEFLNRCLTSLQESGHPFELIVHDDGSSEPEAGGINQVLHYWVNRGLISTVIRNTPGHNQGVGESVRRMFQLASGDPLIKIDQDCLFEAGWLAEFVRVLEGDADEVIGTLGGFRYWHPPCHADEMLVELHDDYDEVKDYVSSTFAVRRAVWEAFGPQYWETHSEAFAEDVGFKRALSSQGFIHALTKNDLIFNDGFGVGPSTVVPDHGTVATINKEPHIYGR